MNFELPTCPCAAPPSFEHLMAIEAGIDESCVCDPLLCEGPPARPTGLADLPLEAAALALAAALRAGIPLAPDSRPVESESVVFERRVLSAVVSAYEEDGDLDGARSARARLTEFEAEARRTASDRRITVTVPVAPLRWQLAFDPSEQAEVDCCQVVSADRSGPLQLECRMRLDGSRVWEIRLVLGTPAGAVVVGPVSLELR